MAAVDGAMRDALARGVFPGAVLLVARGPEVLWHRAYGVTHRENAVPVRRDTLFDLASLTKPLATSLAVLHLVSRRQVDLDQPVGEILPRFQIGARRRITIQHLLRHTSGLPAYRPYYASVADMSPADARRGMRRWLAEESLLSAPGHRTCYSDLGFMLLAWVVEKVARARLDQLIDDTLYRPLGIEGLGYRAGSAAQTAPGGIAATEYCRWRGRLLQGEVHDENCAAVGGIEGHAGLFGTASAIHRLLLALGSMRAGTAPQGLFPSPLMRRWLRRDRHSGRALGFDTPAVRGSSSGRFFSPHSVGHLGFTGSSFWWDLQQDLMVVLLTNRVHPTRSNLAIRGFRPYLHDVVMKSVASARSII
jgi:CubicO group peptidase (beta-lactamase class C family)